MKTLVKEATQESIFNNEAETWFLVAPAQKVYLHCNAIKNDQK